MASNLDILFPDAERRQLVSAALDDAMAGHVAKFTAREEAQQQWLRAELEARARAEAMCAEERTLRRSAEDWAKTEHAARLDAEEKVIQGREREAVLQSALAAEQAGRTLVESQQEADDASADGTEDTADKVDLAPITAALAELTRSVAAMQKMLGAQRSMPTPTTPQPATYSFVPRRDGAGVIREIVATPV